MKLTKLKVTLDRKGNVLSEEIVGFEEVDRDTYYRPLVMALKEGYLKYEKEMEMERRRLQNEEDTSDEGTDGENSDLAVG